MFAIYKVLNASPLLEGRDITEFDVIFGMTTQSRVENSPGVPSSCRVVNLKLPKTYTRTKPFDVSPLKPTFKQNFSVLCCNTVLVVLHVCHKFTALLGKKMSKHAARSALLVHNNILA